MENKKDFLEIWAERGLRILALGVLTIIGGAAAYVARDGGAPCEVWQGFVVVVGVFVLLETIAGSFAGEMPRTVTWCIYAAIRLAIRTCRYIIVAEYTILSAPLVGAVRFAYRGIRACGRLAYRGIRACGRIWENAGEAERAAISLSAAAAVWAAMILPLVEW